MARPYRLIVTILFCASVVHAGERLPARKAWAKLCRRYPILGRDIDIVRACPDVLGRELKQFIEDYAKAPQAARALYLLGRYHMSRKEMSVSCSTFWQAVERFPQTDWADKSAHMIVGMYGAVGLWDGAHKQVERLEKTMPKPSLIAEIKRKFYAMEHMQVGKPPVQFSVKDADGKPLSLAAHKGKVVLLFFWASWCPPCREETANVAQAYKQFHGKGLEIVGVSLDRDLASYRGFCKEAKITWPNYVDGKGWKNELALKFDITEIPQIYLIDRAGILRYKNTRRALVRARVKRLLEGRIEEEDDGIWE